MMAEVSTSGTAEDQAARDHDVILTFLNSNDWQEQLSVARLKREQVLAERARLRKDTGKATGAVGAGTVLALPIRPPRHAVSQGQVVQVIASPVDNAAPASLPDTLPATLPANVAADLPANLAANLPPTLPANLPATLPATASMRRAILLGLGIGVAAGLAIVLAVQPLAQNLFATVGEPQGGVSRQGTPVMPQLALRAAPTLDANSSTTGGGPGGDADRLTTRSARPLAPQVALALAQETPANTDQASAPSVEVWAEGPATPLAPLAAAQLAPQLAPKFVTQLASPLALQLAPPLVPQLAPPSVPDAPSNPAEASVASVDVWPDSLVLPPPDLPDDIAAALPAAVADESLSVSQSAAALTPPQPIQDPASAEPVPPVRITVQTIPPTAQPLPGETPANLPVAAAAQPVAAEASVSPALARPNLARAEASPIVNASVAVPGAAAYHVNLHVTKRAFGAAAQSRLADLGFGNAIVLASGFTVAQTQVAFYRGEDAGLAQTLARLYGGQTLDLTGFTPAPAAHTLDIYLKG